VDHRPFAKDLILSIQIEFVALFGRAGGESVSQSPLKDQAFSTFLDQNPLFELPPENGFSPSTKACPTQWPVVDNSATRRLAKGKLPVAPLSLIAVQSRNLMVAQPVLAQPFNFRRRSTS
jgi:hypothetical protein